MKANPPHQQAAKFLVVLAFCLLSLVIVVQRAEATPPEGFITGAGLRASEGLVRIDNLTVWVDPDRFSDGDRLEWWTGVPIPNPYPGFVEATPRVMLLSTVGTPVIFSFDIVTPGEVFWLQRVPTSLDRIGDGAPWTAPLPSTQLTEQKATLVDNLQANNPFLVVAAEAADYRTEQQTENNIHFSWMTPSGQLPARAARMQTAVRTFFEFLQQTDPACPSFGGSTVKIVDVPFHPLFGGKFSGRYQDGTIFYMRRVLPSDDELELIMTHEAAHYAQAKVFNVEGRPYFDLWMKHQGLAPFLSEFNPYLEAYAAAMEVRRYVTRPYLEKFAEAFDPWPDRWNRFQYDPNDHITHYQYGLPLAYLIENDGAPSLCEFWGDPGLPQALLNRAVNQFIDIDTEVYAQWVHNWNSPTPGMRDNLMEWGADIFGDADPIGLTPRLPPGQINGIVHDLAPICRGGTMHLDFSEETNSGGPGTNRYSFHNVDPTQEHDISIVYSRADSQSINVVGLAGFSQNFTRGYSNFQSIGVGTPANTYYVTYERPDLIPSTKMYIGRSTDLPCDGCGVCP